MLVMRFAYGIRLPLPILCGVARIAGRVAHLEAWILLASVAFGVAVHVLAPRAARRLT